MEYDDDADGGWDDDGDGDLVGNSVSMNRRSSLDRKFLNIDELKILTTMSVKDTEISVNVDTKIRADNRLGQLQPLVGRCCCCIMNINDDEEEILFLIDEEREIVVVVGKGLVEYDDDGDDDNDGGYVVVVVWRKLYFNGNMTRRIVF